MNGRLSGLARRRRRVAIDAAMVIVIVVLIVQMWLLTATLEAYLAGHHDVVLPAFVASCVLFGVCALLYRLVLSVDRLTEPEEQTGTARPGPWQIP